jgi:hypothetical protein
MYLLLSVCTWMATSPTDAAIKDVLDAIDAAHRQIRSYDVYIRTETRMFAELKNDQTFLPLTQPAVRQGLRRQMSYEGNVRSELLDPTTENTVRCATYNKEVAINFNIELRLAAIDKWLGDLAGHGEDYRDLCGAYMGAPIIFYMRERTSTKLIRRTHEGLITLECQPEPREGIHLPRTGFEATFDATHGMLARDSLWFIHRGQRKDLGAETSITSYKKLDTGVWVPTEGITVWRWPTPGPHYRKITSSVKASVDLARSRWNIEIPREKFTQRLPAGTQVVDRIRKLTYVTGKPDAQSNLKAIAAEARDVMALSEPKPTKPSAGGSVRWPWYVVGTALAAIALVFMIRRYRGIAA